MALESALSLRRHGITMASQWFCSRECFRQALEVRIGHLLETSTRKPPLRDSRLPLGLVLLTRGAITRGQLEFAVRQQRARGLDLGDLLCEMKLTTEEEIAEAAAMQWSCPVFRPKSRLESGRTHVPQALMRLYRMAPVHFSFAVNQLLVGFVHKIEHQVLHMVEQITSCRVAPCVITAGDYWRCLQGQSDRTIDVSFDRVRTPPEMANIIQSYAFEVGAEEALLAVCPDYVWSRLNRDGHPTDLVFGVSSKANSTWEPMLC